jgi:hypothetical protein
MTSLKYFMFIAVSNHVSKLKILYNDSNNNNNNNNNLLQIFLIFAIYRNLIVAA